jgi:hypothetical protein
MNAVAPHEVRRLAARATAGNMETAPTLFQRRHDDPRAKFQRCQQRNERFSVAAVLKWLDADSRIFEPDVPCRLLAGPLA